MASRILNNEHLEAFAKWLNLEEKSSATCEKYIRDIYRFMEYAADESVSKEVVARWKNDLIARGYAVRSINSMLASVNSFLGYLGWHDCKVKNIRLQRQTYCAEEKELTKAEYLRLLEASRKNEQLNLVLQTICGTGIRVSELRYFTVEAVRHGKITVNCKSKTRTILVPGKLKKLLMNYAKQKHITTGTIFVGKKAKPLDRSSIWRQMKQLCKAAGVKESKVFPHGLGKKDSERPFTTTSANGDFGTIAINTETVDGITKSTGEVRYTLNTSNGMQMEKEDTFVYAVKYTGSIGTLGYYYSTVTVIPATTIYYEDDFVDFSVYDFDSDTIVTSFTGKYSNNAWTPVGTTENETQGQDRPGEYSFPKVDANNIYGHDGAYTDMATYSLGSARKVTVDKDVYAQAQFTFNGTGFDVISLTSDDTGTILVDVFEYEDYRDNGIAATPVASHFVDTYYGYKYVDGQWVADPGVEEILYQVPVMKVSGLPYGKYTAVITATYKSGLDHNKTEGSTDNYDFYLDAIRIYDPANDGAGNQVIEDAYVADGEGWPEYFELRNLIISRNDFDNLKDGIGEGIVFIDNTKDTSHDVTYSISDYTNYGPNNELYLAPGQSIAFELSVTDPALEHIHLAMKSVGGTAYVKYYDAGSTTAEKAPAKEIATATDLYYDITSLNGKTVVITNTGTSSDAILSITNVKVTYKSEHTDSIENSYFRTTRETGEAAVASLMMMRPPVVPEVPEVPETTVPETTVPETTVPETTVPETTVPETTVPEETVPETTVPEEPEEPEVFEPKKFSVKLSDSSVKVGSKVTVTVTTGTDVDCITVNGVKVSKYSGSRYSSTRTWQVRVEAEEVGQMDVAVVCYNSENLASQPIVRTVTVTKQYTSITNAVKDIITGFFDRLWGSR